MYQFPLGYNLALYIHQFNLQIRFRIKFIAMFDTFKAKLILYVKKCEYISARVYKSNPAVTNKNSYNIRKSEFFIIIYITFKLIRNS